MPEDILAAKHALHGDPVAYDRSILGAWNQQPRRVRLGYAAYGTLISLAEYDPLAAVDNDVVCGVPVIIQEEPMYQ